MAAARRLAHALSLGHVGSEAHPRAEPKNSIEDIDRGEGINISEAAGARPHGHGGKVNQGGDTYPTLSGACQLQGSSWLWRRDAMP